MQRQSGRHGAHTLVANPVEPHIEAIAAETDRRHRKRHMHRKQRHIERPVVPIRSSEPFAPKEHLFQDIGNQPNPDDRLGDDHPSGMMRHLMLLGGSDPGHRNKIGGGNTRRYAVPEK